MTDPGFRERIAKLTPEQLDELMARMKKSGPPKPAGIEPRPSDAPMVMSFAQQRLWFLHQLDPKSVAYNMPMTLDLRGALEVEVLKAALSEVLRRHEVLRTSFPLEGEEVIPVVQDEMQLPWTYEDLSGEKPADLEALVRDRVAREVMAPFDLAEGPVIRFGLFSLSEESHVLSITTHHVASDGWSLGILMTEVSALYAAFSNGAPSPIPEPVIQYSDFAHWQKEWLQGEVLEGQVDYWRNHLDGSVGLELHPDKTRPPIQTFTGGAEFIGVPGELVAALEELTRKEGLTLAITTQAAFNILLHRYTGQDDIVIGSPIANRNRGEIEGLIGCFVNTLVMRSEISGNPTFREVLHRVADTALEAYDHQDLPFDQLVDELQAERDPSRNPFFQIMFAFQNTPGGNSEFSGLEIKPFDSSVRTTRFDLECHIFGHEKGLSIALYYNVDLFSEETIRRFGQHYAALLAEVAKFPDSPIGSLSLMSDQEQAEVLSESNAPALPTPKSTVIDLFENQAGERPEALAVEYDGATITYGELNDRSSRLAHWLTSQGVGPDVIVGVCMERSIEMVVGALATLKAGGAYLPVDPESPPSRVKFMLEDANCGVLLSKRKHADRLPEVGPVTLYLDDEWHLLEEYPTSNPETGPKLEDLAYLIYTSGSTGRPKGVAVEHGTLVNLITWHHDAYFHGSSEKTTQLANVAFDASVWEIWPSITAGASLHIPNAQTIAVPEKLIAWLCDRDITVSFLPTPLAEAVMAESWPEECSLNFLLTGGDRLRAGPKHPMPFRLVNHYGPTENTVVATCCEVPVGAISPPIGKPISNNIAYVLDPYLNPVPTGVPGQLFIGGASVTRGYLNRPELTAERFIPDPFQEASGNRIYATGDIVRRLSDGSLEFLGRNDEQAKVRGYRIELGEIESVLSDHSSISETVALARADQGGEKQLVAYVVLAEDNGQEEEGESEASGPAEPSVEEFAPIWRAHLRGTVPEYMIPSAFVIMDAIPLTPNGKVDRRKLPEPDVGRQLSAPATPPRNILEERLAKLWEEVLGISGVGVHDNFFDLGGHSLKLLQVHRKIVSEMETDLAVVELFEFPTISALANRLEGPVDTGLALGEARRRVEKRGRTATADDIAIVGMSGRFPGAGSVDQLWEGLRAGKEFIRRFTEEELLEAGVPHHLIQDPSFVGARGFMDHVDKFDAGHFGFSPREAEMMDPQHRLFLEVSWAVMEDAGYLPDAFDGPVGVFGGTGRNSYQANIDSRPDLAAYSGVQGAVGGQADFLTTRVSYKLNLGGPSVNVQTACSTSLVAVHMACASLRAHECDMALAGGVSAGVPLVGGYIYQEDGIVSPDGHCRTFDASSKGTVPGNGVAMVALRRLEDAVAAGDVIHAVIRGTATNNDGSAKVGFTAPGIEGQARVIAMALADGGVDPDTIGYVEAHGTATRLGDPIEVSALSRVYGGPREGASPCAIGSLKSNTGHLDAAAGVASLIKAALCVREGELVPSLHFEEPNPEIDFQKGPFYVETENRPWEGDNGQPRRAAVSSFGLGGTNAHVILEEAPQREEREAKEGIQLLTLSARTQGGLADSSSLLAKHLRARPQLPLAEVAHTLQTARTPFRWRRVVSARTNEEAISALSGKVEANVWTSKAKERDAKVAFLFPGQGAQYPGMGRGLYDTQGVFRQTINACADQLGDSLGKDLREILYGGNPGGGEDDALTRRTLVTQSALFAVELAMARQWMAWGVTPSACIGHSIGEYVAACVSGALSDEDGLNLLVTRGRLMEDAPEGAMIAVPLSEESLSPRLGEGLWLSVINGPEACVVAGVPDRVAKLEAGLQAEGIECRRLHTAGAFHSGLMDSVIAPLNEVAKSLQVGTVTIPYVSNVTGDWVDPSDLDPSYWGRHVRGTVRFNDGLTRLMERGADVLLEVGPGNTLGTLARRRLRSDDRTDLTVVTSLRHARQDLTDEETVSEAVGRLWGAGLSPDFDAYAGMERHRVRLPSYPFSRDRYWIEPGDHGAGTHRPTVQGRGGVQDWLHTPVWKQVTPHPMAVEVDDSGEAPWLVTLDGQGVGEAAAQALEGRGHKVIRVANPSTPVPEDWEGYLVDPKAPEGFRTLFEELAEGGVEPRRIVHTLGLADGPEEEASFDRGFYSFLHLLQGLTAPEEGLLGVTVVTNRVFSIAGEPVWSPQRAAALGLCRVAPQNVLGLRCLMLDLDEDATRMDPRTLAGILETPPGQIAAYRKGRHFVRTLDPLPLPPVKEVTGLLRQNGSYLITGGLGNVGLAFAGLLASSVGAKLTLVSRSEVPITEDEANPRAEAVKALREAGAEVLVVRADVGNKDQMSMAIQTAEEHFGELHGVIHAAGVTSGESFKTLDALTQASFEEQFHPKWKGLEALHESLGERALDFCALTSSLSVELGGLQYGAYASGNAIMDHLSEQFNGPGKTRWISVGWDGWDFMGGIESGAQEFGLTPQEGGDAFGRILASHGTHTVSVCTGDYPTRLAESVPTPRTEPSGDKHERPELDTDYVEPRDEIEEVIAQAWADVLGLDRVGAHDDFFELGGDSLIAIQLMGSLGTAYSIEIGVQTLFEAPTVAELAAHIRAAATAAREDAGKVARLVEMVSQMTDEEVEAALASGEIDLEDLDLEAMNE